MSRFVLQPKMQSDNDIHENKCYEAYEKLQKLINHGYYTRAEILINSIFSLENFCFKNAVLLGDMQFIKFLVMRNATFNVMSGETILHYAVKGNNPAIVEYLLNNGYKKHINDKNTPHGNTPLIFGLIMLGNKLNKTIIKLLCDNGADVQIENEYGENACDLMWDCFYQDESFVRAMLTNLIGNQQTTVQAMTNHTEIQAQMQSELATERANHAKTQSELATELANHAKTQSELTLEQNNHTKTQRNLIIEQLELIIEQINHAKTQSNLNQLKHLINELNL